MLLILVSYSHAIHGSSMNMIWCLGAYKILLSVSIYSEMKGSTPLLVSYNHVYPKHMCDKFSG